MRRAWLIYNPAAGRYPPHLPVKRAAAALTAHGWRVRVHAAESAAHTTALAREAARQGLDAVFVAGGDGTIGQAAAGLMGSSTALGVLPAGTANVLAQDLGLPSLSWLNWRALEASAHLLAQAPAFPVDVGRCNGVPFLLWAGTGLDALVVHRLEPRRRWEKSLNVAKYATFAVWTASTWHGIPLEVEVDDRRLTDTFLLAVAANIRRYAGGLALLAPNAYLDDGRMDLWLFRGQSFSDTLQRAWELLSGRHPHSSQVIHLPFRRARLRSRTNTPLAFQIDGEPHTLSSEVTLEVVPRALRLLIPAAQAPRLLCTATQSTPNTQR